jgi:predicted kinase
MTQLTIIRGIPGSGKSTLAARLMHVANTQGEDAIWFEADMFFTRNGVYNWNPEQLSAAHSWCFESAAGGLIAGKSVFVSNTFTLKRELRPYFDLIHELNMNPTVICMQSNFGSVHGVPDGVLLNMKKRFCYDISDMFKVY